jgi:hypothetical protein
MAVKFQGGKAVPVEQNSFPLKLKSTLLDNNVVIWEGSQQELQRIGAKLQSKGYQFTVRPGFAGRYEMQVDAGSVMRQALRGLGLPLA